MSLLRQSRPSSTPGRLRARHLAVLLIAAHAPLTLLWAVVPTTFASSGVVATPLVFAIAGIILVGFVVGYSGLGRRIRHPGGLYVVVVQGLGRPAGLGAAILQFLGYIGLLAGFYGQSALTLKVLMVDVVGVDPPTGFLVSFWVGAVLALSQLSLRTTARLGASVLALQALVLLWFLVAAVSRPLDGTLSVSALDTGGLLSGSFGVALVLAVVAFVGSEGATAYTTELADPYRAVPRATYFSYLVITLVLVVGAWATAVVVGAETAAATPTGASLPEVLARLVGPESANAAIDLGRLNLCIGLLMTAVVLNNAAARQIAGLGRDGLLPVGLAPETAAQRPPAPATLIQPALSGVIAVAATFTAGTVLPLWLGIASGLAIVGVLTLASASSALWFLRGEADESGFFGWEGQVIAGLFSIVTTGGVFLFGVFGVRQVAPGAPEGASWLVALLVGVVFLTGVVVALGLRVSRPTIYASIGRTDVAATARA
ncbi:APC family permease [Cryptosporangium sp. NPDC051539]|uniref:APC family permease n=1 Tax=Cryptosporangium sp. NPDC051539 TaxID=3363962 RepID=UPI0037A1BC50